MVVWISNRVGQFAYFDAILGQPDWAAAKVLDFGGNTGNILLDSRCTIRPESYWCLDIERDAIAQGQRRFPAAHFVGYDRYNFEYNPGGTDQPLPDLGQRFDIVLAMSVFTHTSKTEMRDLVEQLRSMMTEDGVLAFTFIDPYFLPPDGWARGDEYPGLDNLMWRLVQAPDLRQDPATIAAEARQSRLTWATIANNEQFVSDSPDEWVSAGDERSQYITLCTEEHMQSIYPDAEVTPPVRPERFSCCVLRSQ